MINESEIRLISEHKRALKTLSGFRKHHRLPEKGTVVSDDFLFAIALEDLNDDVDTTFSKLRSKFGLKRKQIQAIAPSGNFAEISTPGFTYEVSVSTIQGESNNVLWRRAIARIEDAASVSGPEFENTFGQQFNALEIILKEPVSVEHVIDEVEDCDDDSVKVDYEKDATWCLIEFSRLNRSMHVEADKIRVLSASEISPADLIDTFLTTHAQFFESARPT